MNWLFFLCDRIKPNPFLFCSRSETCSYFFLGSSSQRSFPSCSIMALRKGTVGRADSLELIAQAGTKHCNGNIKTHVSFWISYSRIANLLFYFSVFSFSFHLPFTCPFSNSPLFFWQNNEVPKTSLKRQYNFIPTKALAGVILMFCPFSNVLMIISFKLEKRSNCAFLW